MTLNGVMAVILRYFSQFGSFQGVLRIKVVEDIPKLPATEMLPKAYFLAIYHL